MYQGTSGSASFAMAGVDDDDSVRAAVGSLVRSLGFEVLAFPSAEAFLATPRLDEVACLITDVQMPGMGGVELQSALAASGRALPIIFITAFPEERVRLRAEAAGAFGFLTKPFEGQAMIRCLEAALADRGIARP
jgi:FixJ family two-component response regulator